MTRINQPLILHCETDNTLAAPIYSRTVFSDTTSKRNQQLVVSMAAPLCPAASQLPGLLSHTARPTARRHAAARHSRKPLQACRAVEVDATVPKESLIPQVLAEMETDEEYQELLKQMEKGQVTLTQEERAKRQRSLDGLNVKPFQSTLKVRARCAVLLLFAALCTAVVEACLTEVVVRVRLTEKRLQRCWFRRWPLPRQ